jgi:N-acetyl-anhydromuramyl-L-alanine amidase AmpD
VPIYRDIYFGPPKWYGDQYTRKQYITIHATANDAPARNENSYSKTRKDKTSSHFYVDDEALIQSLNTDLRAFHVGSVKGNAYGIAYEITGDNDRSESWWKQNVAWSKLAASIKRDMAHWGIEAQLLTVAQIKAGRESGIITHNQARLAWGGSDHTDPGEHFPMAYLVDLVNGAKPAPAPPGRPSKPTTPTTDVGAIVANLPVVDETDSGKYVRRVQALCIAWGGEARKAIEGTGGVDGRFGSGTKRGVQIVQRAAGLADDGIVGPLTWPVLIAG